MGSTVCQAVASEPGLELVAAIDPHHVGLDVRQVTGVEGSGLQVVGDPGGIGPTNPDVAVDFTRAEAARENLEWCAANGVHAVVGTTGFTEADLDKLRGLFTSSNCFIAPNFAVGA